MISVAVAHGNDPRLVKAILLKVAQDHLNVMTSPEPFVDFEDFNADFLNFKLYAYIYDLSKGTSTRTDLRIGSWRRSRPTVSSCPRGRPRCCSTRWSGCAMR